MILKICARLHFYGFQSRFKVFTQMSPEGVATLGWNILVKKYPLGGVYGKSLPITSLQRKIPPWKGVSTKFEFVNPNRKLTWADNVSLDVHDVSIFILVENHGCKR